MRDRQSMMDVDSTDQRDIFAADIVNRYGNNYNHDSNGKILSRASRLQNGDRGNQLLTITRPLHARKRRAHKERARTTLRSLDTSASSFSRSSSSSRYDVGQPRIKVEMESPSSSSSSLASSSSAPLLYSWRLDKLQWTSSFRLMKDNVLKLCAAPPATAAKDKKPVDEFDFDFDGSSECSSDEKLRRLIIDLEAPAFTSLRNMGCMGYDEPEDGGFVNAVNDTGFDVNASMAVKGDDDNASVTEAHVVDVGEGVGLSASEGKEKDTVATSNSRADVADTSEQTETAKHADTGAKMDASATSSTSTSRKSRARKRDTLAPSGTVLRQLFFLSGVDPPTDLMDNFEALNIVQRRAVEKILRANDYSLMLGMPGTGKSTCIVFLVRVLVAMGRSVLLSSYTNSALDNLLIKLSEFKVDLVRIGNARSVHPTIKPYTIDMGSAVQKSLAKSPAAPSAPGKKRKVASSSSSSSSSAPPAAVATETSASPPISFSSVAGLESFLASKQVVGTTCLGITHPIFSKRCGRFGRVDCV